MLLPLGLGPQLRLSQRRPAARLRQLLRVGHHRRARLPPMEGGRKRLLSGKRTSPVPGTYYFFYSYVALFSVNWIKMILNISYRQVNKWLNWLEEAESDSEEEDE